MTEIICIADLHVSRHPEKNKEMADRLASLYEQHPDSWLLICGDVTDDGHPDQYAEAVKLLDRWRERIILCPGNHDYGTLGIGYESPCVAAWQAFSERLGARAEVVLPPNAAPAGGQSGRSWRVLALDSCSATHSPLDWAQGELGCGELGAASLAVARARKQGQRLCLALHHDPFCSDVTMCLRDAEAFLQIAEDADMVVWGHTHQSRAMFSGIRKAQMRSLGSFRQDGDHLVLS